VGLTFNELSLLNASSHVRLSGNKAFMSSLEVNDFVSACNGSVTSRQFLVLMEDHLGLLLYLVSLLFKKSLLSFQKTQLFFVDHFDLLMGGSM